MSKRKLLRMSASGLAVLAIALWIGNGGVGAAGAEHVRWDIINLAFTTPPDG